MIRVSDALRLASFGMVFLASTNAVWAKDPFPLALGGDYELIDQYGNTRTQADPNGHAQLVFFGYINCPDICTAAMPMMAQVTNALAADGIEVTPVMITIAPEQDRVETMAEPLAERWGIGEKPTTMMLIGGGIVFSALVVFIVFERRNDDLTSA